MNKLKAYAKINLNIHFIPKKLKNGLYSVKYINTQINLFDEISIKNSKNKVELTHNDKQLPKNVNNLIYKAAAFLKNEAKNNNLGVKIKLLKNIPLRGGFGGGSSDATSVLLSLVKMWKLNITKKQLFNIANKLGKEVFYFLKGGVCEVLKDGSFVNKIKGKVPKIWLVLISPRQKKPSTGFMFKKLVPKNLGKQQIKFKEMQKAIITQNKDKIIKNLHNDFETLAIKKYPEILKIKTDLKNNGAANSLMTGAGLYIVGFFKNKKVATIAYNNLRIKYKSVILTHTK